MSVERLIDPDLVRQQNDQRTIYWHRVRERGDLSGACRGNFDGDTGLPRAAFDSQRAGLRRRPVERRYPERA